MSSVNKVVLIGNLGRDPEIRNNPDGGKVITLSLATSEKWTDKNSGEKKQTTEWHRIVVFNQRVAELAENYLKKGSKIYIEGQLKTRKWLNKKGEDVYTTEVVLSQYRGELIMLYKHNSETGDTTEPDSDGWETGAVTETAPLSAAAMATSTTRATPQNFNDLQDEIPF